jgi:serine/threonine protein kinase
MPNTPRTEESIFAEALDKSSPDERAAFLDRACGDDPALRERVESLLKSHGEAGSFLGKPLLAQGSTLDYQPVTEGPGTVIGRYKLLQPLGEGGFGAVYMAEQKEPVRRRVALKIIKLGMDTKEVIARFEAERQALAMMDHPNIANVLDAGTTETGRPYFVMELVKGASVTELSDKNQLAARDRLELFTAICHGVQHAHQKGVIHRDLKPSNILVTLHDGKPVPKVIDFGVAKALNQELTEKTLFTAYGHMVGTPQYMSPEQAEMSGLDVDTRSDVYSLGVLLYELLTGTTPVEAKRLRGANYAEMQRIIREDEPPRPSQRVSTLGEQRTVIARDRHCNPVQLRQILRGELDWIVMKALEKDRTRRYETANGLARDIQRYLADEPVEACPPSAGYKLRKFARKYSKALATLAVCVGMLLLGTVTSTWLAMRATAAEREAAAQRDAALQAEQDADLQRHQAQKKEAAAQAEATKARTLVRLLQQLLGTANPDSAKGPTYTVRQMLDDFEAGLGDRLKGQPDVEADLRITIGLAYFSNNLHDRAQAQFRRALELRRSFFGSEHVKVAEVMTHLAWSLRYQHAWWLSEIAGPAAEKQAREAVRLYRKLGERNESLARALLVLGFKFGGQSLGPRSARGRAGTPHALGSKFGADLLGSGQAINLDEAEAALREALTVAERCAQSKPSPLVAEANRSLAVCLLFRGRAEDAKPLAARAVQLHHLVHGDRHPETARSFLDLGYIHLDGYDFAEAEQAFREALTIFRRAYGDGFQLMPACALRNLVFTLDAQYKDAEADAITRECLAAWRKPDYSFHTGDLIPEMRGLACDGRGDHADAEAHYRQALEISRKQPGLFPNPLVLVHSFQLGGALFLQGKYEQARAAVEKFVPLARAASRQTNTPPLLLTPYAGLLLIGGSGEADDLQAALSLAQQGVERSKDQPPERRALAGFVLAVAQWRNGDRQRAIQLLREAQELPRPRATLERRMAERALVQYLKEMGDLPAVEKALREVLRQRQTAWPKGHPEIAAAQVNLAGFLTAQKQHAEAEPLLLAAYESLKTHAQADSRSLKRRRAETVERLVQLYDAWGRREAAVKWRKELETTKAGPKP